MMLQVTAYEVFGQVHVLVQTSEVTAHGRSYDVIVQELVDPHRALLEPWDLAWLVAGLISDRAAERAPRLERPSAVAGGTAALPGDRRLSD